MYADVTKFDEYLLTIEEARAMMRMNRVKFVEQYLETQKIRITLMEDGKKMIMLSEMRRYLDSVQHYLVKRPRRPSIRPDRIGTLGDHPGMRPAETEQSKPISWYDDKKNEEGQET